MTAEEFLKSNIRKDCLWEDMNNLTNCPVEDVTKTMIEFAQYHVKQCLLEASENAQMIHTIEGDDGDWETYKTNEEIEFTIDDDYNDGVSHDEYINIDKESILNSYPDDRIK